MTKRTRSDWSTKSKNPDTDRRFLPHLKVQPEVLMKVHEIRAKYQMSVSELVDAALRHYDPEAYDES